MCFARVEGTPLGAMRVRNTLADPGFVQPSERALNERTVAFLGTLDYAPNRDAALYAAREVLPLLRDNDPEVELVVIGECDEELSAMLALSGARVTGYVEELGTALEGVSAMLIPVRSGSGSSIKIIDALARGIPVIASSFGVRGLGLQPDVHFLLANEPDAYLAAWSRLQANYPIEAEALSKAGREYYDEHLSMSAQKHDIDAAMSAAYLSAVR